jgi:hypothetical protein
LHINGNGVALGNVYRKVLTTRNDGHILITFNKDGSRSYQSLSL